MSDYPLFTSFFNYKVISFLQNIIISGDFNADCGYLPDKAWADISLRTNTHFTWLITDDVDTTVGTSSCSYDRLDT